MGKAKALAENEDFDHIKEEAVSLLKYINDMEISEIVAAIKRINDFKLDVSSYLDIISARYFSNILYLFLKNQAIDIFCRFK